MSNCAECGKEGTEIFSVCGHILHKNCYKILFCPRSCPKCKSTLTGCMEFEAFFIKIKSMSMGITDSEFQEYCKFLESFEYFHKGENEEPYDGNILERLEKVGWDINDGKFGGVKPFYIACTNNDLEKVNLLIEHRLDWNNYGQKGLKYACEHSSFDVYERLIKLGVPLNNNIIFTIIDTKGLEMLKRVIKDGIDVNFSGENGEKPVHRAASIGSIDLINFLSENGADFNAVDEEGQTILHYACRCSEALKLVKYLIESGFDIEAKTGAKVTPLMMAKIKKLLKKLSQNKYIFIGNI